MDGFPMLKGNLMQEETLRASINVVPVGVNDHGSGNAYREIETQTGITVELLDLPAEYMLPFETKVKVGSVILNSDTISNILVPHNENVEPYMVAVWVYQPTNGWKDGTNKRLHSIWIKNDVLASVQSSVGMVVRQDDTIATGHGYNNDGFVSYPQNGNIVIGCSSLYPLKAGYTYCWEARWL